ncbi:hypothetical protein QFZ51_001512 [Chitinophaga sp. W3I9]|uniref:DUF4296 domain-containing protein n=1 Tax=Chitinophaga sp. W3I9 TaxID=3373924 RepID=UPI003D23B262
MMNMMMKYASLALLVVFLVACANSDQVPGKYISKEHMAGILVDMSIADAYSNEQQMQVTYTPNFDSLRQEKVKVYYKQILDLHKVSVKEFSGELPVLRKSSQQAEGSFPDGTNRYCFQETTVAQSNR